MPRYLRVVKHAEHQHYKNRNPPWIKLHRSCLDSYRFTKLPDAGRWHALGIALLASQTENHVPSDPSWLRSALHSTTKVDVEALIAAEFVEWCDCATCSESLADSGDDASKSLAPRKHVARASREEESREEESREEPPSPRAARARVSSGGNGDGSQEANPLALGSALKAALGDVSSRE